MTGHSYLSLTVRFSDQHGFHGRARRSDTVPSLEAFAKMKSLWYVESSNSVRATGLIGTQVARTSEGSARLRTSERHNHLEASSGR
jgi:hypothetical protein